MAENKNKIVLIVSEGNYGTVSQNEYEELAGLLKIFLENAVSKAKANIDIRILKKAEEVNDQLKQGVVKAVIYSSYGQIENAHKTHRENPSLTVIVHTGLSLPNADGIHIVSKGESLSLERITTLVIS